MKPSEVTPLAWDAVRALTATFVQLGIWPRPPASRRLRVGEDFYYPDVWDSPEVRRFGDWLLKQPGANQNSVHYEDKGAEIAVRLACNVLWRSKTEEPDIKILRDGVRLLCREWNRTYARLRRVVEIVGLQLSVDPLELNKNTQVRPKPWLREYALNWLGGQWTSFPSEVDAHCALITNARNSKKDQAWEHFFPEGELESLLTALRLYCPGTVRDGQHYFLQMSEFPLVEGLSWHPRELSKNLMLGEVPCDVGPKDLTAVADLWRILHDNHFRFVRLLTVDKTRLNVAIDRFNSAYEEDWWITKIVDFTIALDALFGPDDRRGAITQRLKLRTAFLLGRTDDEARAVFEDVGTLYDIRSTILHGSSPDDKAAGRWLRKLTGKTPQRGDDWRLRLEAVEKARKIVRRSLMGAVHLFHRPGLPTWPLPKDFDLQMTMPGAKPVWQEGFDVSLQEDLPHYNPATASSH